MAKLYIPTIKRDFNTDRVLYVNTRTKSKIGGLSHWGNTVPLTVKTPSPIETPTMTHSRSVLTLAQTGNHGVSIYMSSFRTNGNAPYKLTEYEIYKDLEHSNNLVYTGTVAYNPYATYDMFEVPQNVVNDVFVKFPIFYIRARYIDELNNKSAWSNMSRFMVYVVSCTTPQFLLEPMAILEGSSPISITPPVFTEYNHGDTTIIERQTTYPRISLYDAEGRFEGSFEQYNFIKRNDTEWTFALPYQLMSYVSSMSADKKPASMTVKIVCGQYTSAESEKYEIFEAKQSATPQIILPENVHGIYPTYGEGITINVTDYTPTVEGDELELTEIKVTTDPEGRFPDITRTIEG